MIVNIEFKVRSIEHMDDGKIAVHCKSDKVSDPRISNAAMTFVTTDAGLPAEFASDPYFEAGLNRKAGAATKTKP